MEANTCAEVGQPVFPGILIPQRPAFKAEAAATRIRNPSAMHLMKCLKVSSRGLNALFAGTLRMSTAGDVLSYCASLAGLIWNPMTDKPQEGLPDHAADAFRYGNRRLFPPRAGVVFGRA